MRNLLRRLDHPVLLLVLTVLFWSGNWVVGRGMRGEVPPVALAFWRWVIALACTLPFALPYRQQALPALRAHWPVLLALGLLGISGYNTLAYLGLRYTTATNGVLLNSFIPIVIILLGWMFLGKRMRWQQALGLGVSLCGVLVVVAHGEPARLASLSFNSGDLWIMVSVFVWAAYTLLLAKRPDGLHPMLLLALLTAVGVLGLLPLYAWELAQGLRLQPSAAALAGIAYTGIFPAFLGYVFWNRAVARVGAASAGLYIHLMPVATPLLSTLFLGESARLYHLAGMALIIGGILISNRNGR